MSARPVKLRLRPVFLAPVTHPGTIPDLEGIAAVIFRNAGDSTVSLGGNAYTLDSKETLSLNVTEDDSTMDVFQVPVAFTGGTTNKLEIILLKAADC